MDSGSVSHADLQHHDAEQLLNTLDVAEPELGVALSSHLQARLEEFEEALEFSAISTSAVREFGRLRSR